MHNRSKRKNIQFGAPEENEEIVAVEETKNGATKETNGTHTNGPTN
jgi:hypothetical protein